MGEKWTQDFKSVVSTSGDHYMRTSDVVAFVRGLALDAANTPPDDLTPEITGQWLLDQADALDMIALANLSGERSDLDPPVSGA